MYILASNSPRRKEIFEKFNIDFKIVPALINESSVIDDNPYKLAEKIALSKALEVSNRYPDNTVIGADTIVVVDNEILGKPVDFQDAFDILKKLSNRYQEVVTGVAIIKGEKSHTFHAISQVIFRELSDQEIIDYINTGETFGKAGAYAIQGLASDFTISYNGELENIIGFPIRQFLKELEQFESV